MNLNARWVLEEMSQYQDVFHIAIAMFKIGHDFMANPQQKTVSEDILGHKGKAMLLLRQRLSSQSNDKNTFVTIMFLAYVEYVCKNMIAFQMHRQQLLDMAQKYGGIKNLDLSFAGLVVFTS